MAKTTKAAWRVWVVMHYEYMGAAGSPHIDSVQFHVSSSLAKAEGYLRALHTASHGWWQVHPHVVDDSHFLDEGLETHYYSHRGTKLKAAPFKRARAAFDKLSESPSE